MRVLCNDVYKRCLLRRCDALPPSAVLHLLRTFSRLQEDDVGIIYTLSAVAGQALPGPLRASPSDASRAAASLASLRVGHSLVQTLSCGAAQGLEPVSPADVQRFLWSFATLELHQSPATPVFAGLALDAQWVDEMDGHDAVRMLWSLCTLNCPAPSVPLIEAAARCVGNAPVLLRSLGRASTTKVLVELARSGAGPSVDTVLVALCEQVVENGTVRYMKYVVLRELLNRLNRRRLQVPSLYSALREHATQLARQKNEQRDKNEP
eukprot:Hpha_TRINITY_DN18837_c0_g1::TRINITY_DN18837_c0_g1_i1::g.26244::m.26244